MFITLAVDPQLALTIRVYIIDLEEIKHRLHASDSAQGTNR